MLPQKTRRLLALLYVVFLVFSLWYVNHILKVTDVKVLQKQEEKPVEEVKSISAKLTVKFGNNTKTFDYQNLTSNDTVLDLLERARKNKDVIYETTYYTDKTEIKIFEISGTKINLTVNLLWRVYKQNNGTQEAIDSMQYSNYSLTDGDVFVLVQD
jgi:hypothetical protein